MPTLLPLAASLLALCSALALYTGSAHCRWRVAPRRRGRVATTIGWLLAAASLAAWIADLGAGAGLCAMLASWMLALIALPCLAVLLAPSSAAGARGGR